MVSSLFGRIIGKESRTASMSRKVAFATVLACIASAGIAASAQAGPVVTMGIDAEDGGPGAHGPISVYANVVSNGVLANTTNGGDGILVVGGNKTAGDNVTAFWDALGTAVGEPITYVNGAANITAQSFAGFQAIAIASSELETPGGGLTQEENDALAGRQPQIASFVNGGGGLFGTSQTGLSNTYAYLPDAALFTFNTGLSFDDVEATPAGEAVGITDTELDVCCWHDEYATFPSYLAVLATNIDSGNAVALGGAAVTIPELCTNAVDDDGDALVDLEDPNCKPELPVSKDGCLLSIDGKLFQGDVGDDKIVGTDKNDLLKGGAGNDQIEGIPGDDCLFGEEGADAIFGSDGADVITGGAGEDKVTGGLGNDNIEGNTDADNLKGDEDNDTVIGRGANDHVKGNGGNDQARGSGGADKVAGNDGNDTVRGGTDADRVNGGSGNDKVQSQGGEDKVDGGTGEDAIRAGGANDEVQAADGDADTVKCGLGDHDVAVVDDLDKVSNDCEQVIVA